MASTVSFKQLCPSCEHPVPIRDPKLIGKKIDCPKCKYRFVVEEPAAEAGDEEEVQAPKKKGDKGTKNGEAVTAKKPANGKAAAAPAKKPGRRRDDDEADDSAPKKKKGGTSPILWVGIGLAVVAVIGLVIALVLMLGGGEEPKKNNNTSAAQNPPPAEQPKDQGNAGQRLPGEGDAGDTSAMTNLLPNDTQIVRDAKVDKLIASTLGDETTFDKKADVFRKEAFEAKFGFPLDNVARHVQGQNVKQDWVFNVIRTKKAIDWEKLKAGLALEKGKKSPVEGKEYFEITADLDPFSRFWLSDLYLFTSPTRNKPLGVYKSDDQTLVIAELDPLEQFLQKRPVLTEVAGGEKSPPPPAGGGGMGGMAPPGSGGGMGGMAPPGSGGGGLAPMIPSAGGGSSTPPGSGGGMGGMAPPGSGGGMGGMAPPGSGGGMGGMAPPATQPPRPAGPSGSWLSLKPGLKKMLDHLEESSKPPILTFVAEGDVVLEALRKSAAGENLGLDLSKFPQNTRDAKAVGLALYAAQLDRATVMVAVDAPSDAEAKDAESKLNQVLPLIALGFQSEYGIKLTVMTGPGAEAGTNPVGGMFPGAPGVMAPPGTGMRPGGTGGGPRMGGPSGGGPPPSSGEGVETTFQFPGSGGGGGSMRPGGTGGGMVPPGGGNFPGTGQQQPAEEPTSTIAVTRAGTIVSLRLDVKWERTKLYEQAVEGSRELALLAKATAEMSVTRPRIHDLADALKAYTTKAGAFPAGAHDRPAPERFNRPWPPDQRVSWMADVVRYLPQYVAEYGADANRYPLGIDPNKSWNDKENLKAARMVVPQFLAPNRPESQWWVHYPKVTAPVGATHYVGVAGLGLDAADGAPANKRGVFGYDKSASLAEITDGPQNTIAVLQAPADFKTPWLAGGGSTVRGLSEQDGVRPFVCAEHKGKRGTYAIMANGDVRFIYETIPNELFLALVTIAGNEPIDKADLDKFAPLIKPEQRSELVTKPLPPKPEQKNGVAPAPATGGSPVDQARKANDLKQLGLAYHNHLSATGKPPAKVEDLQPYYDNAALTAAVKDGTYVVYWDVKVLQLVNGSSNTVLGYEKDAPTKGGAVLYADGSVKPLTADEFGKALKPPGK